MDSFRQPLAIGIGHIRRWVNNPRIYVVALIVFFVYNAYISPIMGFSQSVHVAITPWIFPMLTANKYVIFMTMLGTLLLFCDAPFIDEGQPYMVIRCGRKRWIAGQMLYIVMASLIFVLFILVITFCMLLPNIEFSGEWGRVLKTLAQTDAPVQFGIALGIPYDIMLAYTPLAATALSALLMWFGCTILGLIMLSLNMVNKNLGTIIGGLFVLLVLVADALSGLTAYYLSPLSWSNLALVDKTDLSGFPSLTYALVSSGIIIVVLVVACWISSRRKAIDVLPPV